MYAKRVRVLSIYEVSYLPKVCPPRASLSTFVRSVCSLTYFGDSTGVARKFHSQASYDYQGDRHTSGYYGWNPDGFTKQTQNMSGPPEDLSILGFLEVFDAFCDKRTVEAAEDVLRLLHKKGIDIDSHRYERFSNLLEEKETTERHTLFIAANASLKGFDTFCEEGKVKEAMEVLPLMDNKHITVDLPRYMRLMKLCGDKEAKIAHEHITRAVSPIDVDMYYRILEMYVSCGSMDDASAVVEDMVEHNLTTWDIMIRSLAENGLGGEAVDLFYGFKQAGLKPDEQLFISFFHACAAAGNVYEGMLHFKLMTKDFGIASTLAHYRGWWECFAGQGTSMRHLSSPRACRSSPALISARR